MQLPVAIERGGHPLAFFQAQRYEHGLTQLAIMFLVRREELRFGLVAFFSSAIFSRVAALRWILVGLSAKKCRVSWRMSWRSSCVTTPSIRAAALSRSMSASRAPEAGHFGAGELVVGYTRANVSSFVGLADVNAGRSRLGGSGACGGERTAGRK